MERILKSKVGPKFAQLWTGDISRYPSASEADLALASYVAFYTQDPQQVVRIVSMSVLGTREKWQEKRGAINLWAHDGEQSRCLPCRHLGPELQECAMTEGNGTDRIQAAITAAQAGDANAPWTATKELAALSAAEYAQVKAQFRKALGTDLNLNDFNHAVAEARRTSRPSTAVAGDGRTNIFADQMQFADAIQATVAALAQHNDPPFIFVQNENLVEVIDGRIYSTTSGRLREVLAQGINFARHSSDGPIDVAPPEKIVGSVLERRRWPLPTLRAVTRVPVLRSDGSIVARPGYDPVTQLYYDPLPNIIIPSVPERPDHNEVESANALVSYMLQDFPFVDLPSKTNYIGLALTAVVRPAIVGPTPLAVIDAAKAGTGKSKLSQVPQLLVFSGGGFMGWPRSERELRNQITSQLRANPGGVCVMDNMPPGRFSSPTLARLLTSTIWEDRLLGENTMLRLPNLSTWIANGNNIMPAGDLPRRTYLIKLEATTAYPWQRAGFVIENFDRWIEENAGKLFVSLLTLARAWYAAGCPAGQVNAVNSYTDWIRIVGGILGFAGFAGFLGNNDELVADSEEDEGWTVFLAELQRAMPEVFTTQDVVDRMYEIDGVGLTAAAEALRAILPEELHADRLFLDKFQLTTKLGRELRNRVGTRYGSNNLYVQQDAARTRTGVRQWRIVQNDGRRRRCGWPRT